MAKHVLGITLIVLGILGIAWAGSDEEALKSRSHTWIKAFNAGDTKALAGLYTFDAKLLPPNSESVQGRESIDAYWILFLEGVKGELEIQEAIIQGDIGYLLGTFRILDETDKVVDRGKYVEIWKKVGGQWQLHRDIWNSSLPQPEPTVP